MSYTKPPRAPASPLPEDRKKAMALAVEARTQLSYVTSKLHRKEVRIASDWTRIKQQAEHAAMLAEALVRLANRCAYELNKAEQELAP